MRRGLLAGVLMTMLCSSVATAQSTWAPRSRRAMTVKLLSVMRARDEPSASTQRLTVVTISVVGSAPPHPSLARVERAIADQSHQLRFYWHTPLVKFVSSGGSLTLKLLAGVGPPLPDGDGTYGGFHSGPIAGVYTGSSDQSWADSASHEVVEMLVDPSGTATLDGLPLEVCDPVVTNYPLDGVYVADFVTPAWFSGSVGPFDFQRSLAAPRRTGPGGSIERQGST